MTNLSEVAIRELKSNLLKSEKDTYFEYRDDPVGFIKDVLRMTICEKQENVINSVKDNRFTVVEAGHGVGKSIAAAMLTCWWISCHEEAKVVTLAPTWTQVANVLWRYIRSMGRKSRLPGNIFETPRWDVNSDRFAIGVSPKKTSAEDMATLHGYHSPNLLVILDEAPGLPKILWTAVRGLAVGENDRILAIGNPIEQSGPFWDACNSPNWHRIRISCLDHPNVKERKEMIPGAVSFTWVMEMIRDHCTLAKDESESGEESSEIGSDEKREMESDRENGEGIDKALSHPPSPNAFIFNKVWYIPNSIFESRVLGRAPAEGSDQLISLAWVETAKLWEFPAEGDLVIGLDPARYGGDAATMVARCGKRVLWIKRRYPRSKNPGAELATWIKNESATLGITWIFIDTIGIGASVIDQCRTMGMPVRSVEGSKKAFQSKRFTNLRSECWWRIREVLQQVKLSLPKDDLLEADLTAPKYDYDDLGRIRLERKEKVQKRLGRSPDSGDALALTFASPVLSEMEDSENPAKALQNEDGSRWFISSKPHGSRWRKFRRN